MALFLLVFNNYVDMNLWYGLIEIIIGGTIYFGVLFLTKGATKEDWKLVKSLTRKNN